MVVRRYSKHFHTSFVFVAFFVNLVKHNRKGNASVGTYVFKSHIKTEYTSRGLRIYVLQIIICSVLAAAYGYGNGFGTCVGGIYNAAVDINDRVGEYRLVMEAWIFFSPLVMASCWAVNLRTAV